jgi:hypothetical protein
MEIRDGWRKGRGMNPATPRWRKVPGQLFMLMGIYRLVTPHRLTDGCRLFGQTDSAFIGKVANGFHDWMKVHWGYLLEDNLQFWVPHFPKFAQAIKKKMEEKSGGQLLYQDAIHPNGFRVCAFIDNTMNAMCRPGGGPANDGVNAPRHDPLIQQAFYTGWKKIHGLKWQTVDAPNGMCIHAFGPLSVRRNDLTSLQRSNINGLFAQCQVAQGMQYQYMMYGDSIYPVLSHLLSRYVSVAGRPLTAGEICENKTFSSCREVIEWDYGRLKTRWSFIDYRKKLKLRARKNGIANAFLCALLLENALTCLNSNQTTTYFNPLDEEAICRPPTLEEWTAAGPR